MTEHIKQKRDIKNLTDQKELAEAIERCNLPLEAYGIVFRESDVDSLYRYIANTGE